MCVFPLLLQLALADTYLGSLSLSSFGSRRPLALTMAGSSGCGGPHATPGLGHERQTHSEHNGFAFGASVDRGGVARIAELQSQGYLYLRP